MGTTTLLVVLNLFGMFPGYASFGWVADHLGRRKSFLLYSLTAALLVPLYAAARSPGVLMGLGTLVAFFGTGLFSGSAIMGSEIFPLSLIHISLLRHGAIRGTPPASQRACSSSDGSQISPD